MVQATEVIKYFTGLGNLLANRLLIWDGLESRAEEIIVEKNPACPVCSRQEHATQGRKRP
jgi:adenylyltransferase/sulfurtransferase